MHLQCTQNAAHSVCCELIASHQFTILRCNSNYRLHILVNITMVIVRARRIKDECERLSLRHVAGRIERAWRVWIARYRVGSVAIVDPDHHCPRLDRQRIGFKEIVTWRILQHLYNHRVGRYGGRCLCWRRLNSGLCWWCRCRICRSRSSTGDQDQHGDNSNAQSSPERSSPRCKP